MGYDFETVSAESFDIERSVLSLINVSKPETLETEALEA